MRVIGIVSGDFVNTGGRDVTNCALARRLTECHVGKRVRARYAWPVIAREYLRPFDTL